MQDLSGSWLRVSIPDADSIHDVAYGNDAFIVIGTKHFEDQPDAQYPSVWLSEDGIEWDDYLVSDEVLINHDILQIALSPTTEGRGIFLAFADKLYTSTTGRNWIPVQKTPWLDAAAPLSLNCANSGYCVALSNGEEQTVFSQSSDFGQTWTSAIVGSTYFSIVDNNQNTFTGVGTHGSIIQGISDSKTSNINWEKVAPQFGDPISSVVFANGQFLAASETYSNFMSHYGEDWYRVDSPSLSFISHGESGFVGSFMNIDSLHIYRLPSYNGTWSLSTSIDGNFDITQFKFDGHQFVFMGRRCEIPCSFDDDDDESNDSAEPVLYTSVYGAEWDDTNLNIPSSYFNDFAWSYIDQIYMAVSNDGSIYTSENLSTWTLHHSIEDGICLSIAVNQQSGIAIAVCQDSNGYATVLRSINRGSTWDEVNPSCELESFQKTETVTYNYEYNMFYLGGTTIFSSTDGINFKYTTTDPVSLSSMDSLIFGNGIFMILSNQAIVSSSFDSLTFSSCS